MCRAFCFSPRRTRSCACEFRGMGIVHQVVGQRSMLLFVVCSNQGPLALRATARGGCGAAKQPRHEVRVAVSTWLGEICCEFHCD
jgi:hypothetical protein